MNMKKLAAFGVFVVTLILALLVTSYYRPRTDPPTPEPPHSPPVIETVAPPPPPAAQVTHKVQLITVDVASRRFYTTVFLERDRNQPAPEKVWVWTAFFVPGDKTGKIYAGDPVELRQPFESVDRITVSPNGACPWCREKGAPASGYYARVNISTESAEDARLADADVSRDISTATPVVIEGERAKDR
jgi:hypothetical protein